MNDKRIVFGVETQLKSFCKLSEKVRRKTFKLLLTLLSNALHYEKYRSQPIHCKNLRKKLHSNIHTAFFNILQHAGFQKDKSRPNYYIWDSSNTLAQIQRVQDEVKKFEQKLDETDKQNMKLIQMLEDARNEGNDINDIILATHQDRQKQYQNSNSMDERESDCKRDIENLSNMGFLFHDICKALELSNDDINSAVNLLLQGLEQKENNSYNCNVKTCSYFDIFLNIFLNYSDHEDSEKVVMDVLLESFYHLLYDHQSNNDFEYIYNRIGHCDIDNCVSIQRNRRNRAISISDDEIKQDISNIVSPTQDIMDQIHCHFLHSFDFGYKVRENNITNMKSTLLNRGKTLQYVQNGREINKFYSFYQSQVQCSKNDLSCVKTYNCGYKYYYWDDDNNTQRVNSDKQQYALHVNPKYNSFKQEMIQNELCHINIVGWNHTTQKAQLKHNTNYCRKITASAVYSGLGNIQPNSFHYILNNEQIALNHLIAIMIYCNYSLVSFKFSETFRPIYDEETQKQIVSRHSCYYYFSRYLHESVGAFCNFTTCRNVFEFYHGINKQMIFDSMSCIMYQPFSTTSSYHVAISFSNPGGMILEVRPSGATCYFNCSWLSDFSYENEMLFIGCKEPILIIDIINIVTGEQHKIYTKAIALLDAMTSGVYFQGDDGTTFAKCMRYYQQNRKMLTLTQCGAKPLSKILRYITIELVKHELYRNEKQQKHIKSKLPLYIDHLFHHICLAKKMIEIDWNLMDVKIQDNCMSTGAAMLGGYHGYSFIKHLFCEKHDTGMINFDVIMKLYPNLQHIKLKNLNLIMPNTLTKIFKLLKVKNGIKFMELKLSENLTVHTTMLDLMTSNVKSKFSDIGINIFAKDKVYDEYPTLIIKRK
eukprot:337025_1